MRRLDILLIGRSGALKRLAGLFEDHGHGVCHADALDALDDLRLAGRAGTGLVIEDGSLPLAELQQRLPRDTPILGLRMGASTTPTLPRLDVLCWSGDLRAQRLIERSAVPVPAASVNGQQLREQAMDTLLDMLASLVARFSRSPQALGEAPCISADGHDHEHGLDWLETLAFAHVFNQTTRADLLGATRRALPGMLDHALHTYADRPALVLDGQCRTYRQLHAQAVAIQRALQPLLPAGKDDRPVVAVCMGKSPDLYASMLAVLGCGAVYLPLDPATPASRLRHILQDASACVLLHDGQATLEMPSLDVRELAAAVDGSLPGLSVGQADAGQPCVVIYTSGTTGQPKGVLLSQGNLAHFVNWYAEHVQLDRNSRVLQFSTIGFDASLLDILPTFVQGATLVIPDETQRRDPEALVTLMHRREVSHAFLPPALLSVLPAAQHLGLAHLVTGGDVCEPQVVARLAGQCQMHNIYGPTETTVLATTRLFAPGDNVRNLGRPIANTQVLILDDDLQPTADQVPGELYIVGPGVGLGYLNKPELTAQRFVNLTLPDGQRVRAYRTGDMGKWTADGIELCGRRDNQVKIRGFRVEPEEIEHCLRESRSYGQVAVVIDEQRRVLAFVARPLSEQAGQALREHARRLLPDYMQPVFYQELEQLPGTTNGKLDRQALLARPLALPSRPRMHARTSTEQRLCQLWSQLLELPEQAICIDDSFFDLGGHSILLSRLLLELRERFGRGVTINRFIERPTLRHLGALLDGRDDAAHDLLAQLEQDAQRDLDLQVRPLGCMGDVHRVIVTGANSFLGIHLVEALLDWGATEVACLVRRGTEQDAAQRFAQAMQENRIELDLARVKVFEADLCRPRLGLSETDYRYLDAHFGVLLHNAAHVNHVLDYPSLAKDNVEPLFECLRLCEGERKKIFNFVSTLSACSALDGQGQVLEEDPVATPPVYIRNGYNLSKWVGERILARARAQGVRVNLFRPGNITFDSRTGISQPGRNRLMLMLKGSLQLGQLPRLDIDFDLMPVDFLARFIAFHASRHQPQACVFNLHNPQPLRWERYLDAFREQGHTFEVVEVADWQRQLGKVGRDNALFDVLGFYLDGFEEDIGDISCIAHRNARAGVENMGEHYPAKTPALLQRGCQYLSDIGFI